VHYVKHAFGINVAETVVEKSLAAFRLLTRFWRPRATLIQERFRAA
jgi:hypothetical protein